MADNRNNNMALQTESIYKTRQMSSKFQHQNGHIRPRRARRVSYAIPVMTDNWKWPIKPKIFRAMSPKLGRQHYNSSGKSEVYDHVEREKVSASDRNTD